MFKFKEKLLNINNEVKSSQKNMRLTYKFQLLMAKAQTFKDMDLEDSIKASLDMLDQVNDYLITVLKLNDKQVELLDDLTVEETTQIANKVALRMMGLSEEEVEDALAPKEDEEENTDTDPKEQKPILTSRLRNWKTYQKI